ncbi:MAG: protein kinase [Symploca sp. SIO2C1]|nr:protein kinase [Symploca sp. SIO2C1]
MSYCLNPNCRKQKNSQANNFCRSCGSRLLLRERYRALEIIGQGGFGKTFLAVDQDKPSKPGCVIKQFLPQLQRAKNIQYAAKLFEQEAVRLDELGKHCQIPELLAYFEQNSQLYLVQEFIDGENLAEELAQKGRFNETQIRQLLSSLLPVLQFVHEHQVIHRDIKPENIIRRRGDGQLVLVDFGAAKFVTGTALLGAGTVIGTPQYTAPEQLKGRANFASDLYSLGVSCLHLLTEVEPLDLFDNSENDWVWRDYLTTSVSDSLKQILDKMVQMGTRWRYQSATEVLQELNQVVTVLTTRTSQAAIVQLEPVRIGKKYGYQNQMGQILIQPQFDFADSFSEGLARIKIDSEYGYIDKTGKVVIQPQFDFADSFSEGLARIKIDSEYGYIDTTGKVVIQPQFDFADNFSEGLARIKIDSEYGYIDTTGKVVIQPQFDFANNFYKGQAWIRVSSESGYIYKTSFSEDLVLVKIGSKYGYIDTTGQLVSEMFDDAGSSCEGLELVKVGSKHGYINTTRQLVIQPKFDEANSFSEDLVLVKIGSQYGYIDTTGQVVSQLFDDVGNFCEGLALVKIDSKYGYIDTTGQLISKMFDDVGNFCEGLALVKIGSKYGYIDITGQLVTEMFDEVWNFSEGLALVKIGSKYGYIDITGQLVSKMFDEVWSFSEGLALVKIGSKYSYIDTTGKLVSRPKFDEANSFYKGLALVKLGSKYAYINTAGQLISQIFDDIKNFSGELASVRIDNKWGYINQTGQLVIPAKFKEAKSFYRGKAIVKIKNKLLGLIPMGEKSRTINKTGEFID